MGIGLEVWDGNANPVFGTDGRLFQFLGQFDIANSSQSGDITDSRFSQGEPFWFPTPLDSRSWYLVPAVNISGNVLTYTGVNAAANEKPTVAALRIFYGIR